MSAGRYRNPAALPAHLSKVPCPALKLVCHPIHMNIFLCKSSLCVSDPLPIPDPCPFLSPHRSKARGQGVALSLCERTCFVKFVYFFKFLRSFVLSDFSCCVVNGMSSDFLQWFALKPGLGCFENFNGVPSGQWYALRLAFGI